MLRKLLCRHQHHHAHQLRGQQLAGRHRKGCLRYTAAQPPALPVVARAFAFAGAGCCPLAGTRAAESGRTSHTARGLLGRLAGQQGCCASVSGAVISTTPTSSLASSWQATAAKGTSLASDAVISRQHVLNGMMPSLASLEPASVIVPSTALSMPLPTAPPSRTFAPTQPWLQPEVPASLRASQIPIKVVVKKLSPMLLYVLEKHMNALNERCNSSGGTFLLQLCVTGIFNSLQKSSRFSLYEEAIVAK
mmetsp:Transcript_4499/g.6371  ORF Transcript_4499/g.6371 Transcript_4499/m.6371 type:complete len:249 (-) Transcript_4499:141-887(-)